MYDVLLIFVLYLFMLFYTLQNNSFNDFFNHSTSGLLCIFALPMFESRDCGNIATYAWIFLFVYLVFFVAALRFLILSQSAVYTVATMTSALPLVGVWWSLFRMAPEISKYISLNYKVGLK